MSPQYTQFSHHGRRVMAEGLDVEVEEFSHLLAP
jgi:hypothetical protein